MRSFFFTELPMKTTVLTLSILISFLLPATVLGQERKSTSPLIYSSSKQAPKRSNRPTKKCKETREIDNSITTTNDKKFGQPINKTEEECTDFTDEDEFESEAKQISQQQEETKAKEEDYTKVNQAFEKENQFDISTFSSLEKMLQPSLKVGLSYDENTILPLEQFGYSQLTADKFSFDPIANPSLPQNYKLGPGDEVFIHNSVAKTAEPSENKTTQINQEGVLHIPGVSPIVVWNLTLTQLNEELKRQTKYLYATLGKLRSIQINIVGEANVPGLHKMPATASVYNILALVDGIKKTGSLRHIQWKRKDQTIAEIDLYDYFLKGHSLDMVHMQSGDTLFIPVIQKAIAIAGQVRRPGIFELKEESNVKEVLVVAGGLLPTANEKRILVERINPTQKRVVETLVLELESPQSSIQNFDIIKVFPISKQQERFFSLVGPFSQQGTFELKPGLTLFEALKYGGKITSEIYVLRGHIQRLTYHPDRPYPESHLVLFDLNKVISQEKDHDLLIQDRDIIQLLAQENYIWIRGEVVNPGKYRFINGMSFEDLLFLASGFNSNAYRERADIHRKVEGKPSKLVAIDLKTQEAFRTLLQAEDVVVVYDKKKLSRNIAVKGEVQNPGQFPFFEGMTVEDALFLAGSFGLNANAERVDIQRRIIGQPPLLLRIELEKKDAVRTLLKTDDIVIVYNNEAVSKNIIIEGHVKAPGTYPFYQGMSVEDALFLGQSFKPTAYREKIYLQRQSQDGKKELIQVPLIRGTSSFPLEADDKIIVYPSDIVASRAISIDGDIVQRPGKYPFLEGMRVKDLIFQAGGLKYKALDSKVILKRWIYGGEEIKRELIHLSINPITWETAPEMILQEEDSVFLRKQVSYQSPRFATISGEILFPGTYELNEGDRVSDLINKAGDFTQKAFLNGSVFTRKLLKVREDSADRRLSRDISRGLLRSTVEASASLTSPETHLQALTAIESKVEKEALIQQSQRDPNQNDAIEKENSQSIGESEKNVKRKEEVKIEAVNVGRLILSLDPYNKFYESPENVELMDGDTLTIPPFMNTVLIKGEMLGEASLIVKKDKTMNYYLDIFGGAHPLAKKEDSYVIQANGMIINSNLENYVIQPGDTIVVPPDLSPRESNLKEMATIVDIIFKTVTTLVIFITLKTAL
ncbi:SLBB domain-containing protein [Deltaproteobacteria bacterium TL4]